MRLNFVALGLASIFLGACLASNIPAEPAGGEPVAPAREELHFDANARLVAHGITKVIGRWHDDGVDITFLAEGGATRASAGMRIESGAWQASLNTEQGRYEIALAGDDDTPYSLRITGPQGTFEADSTSFHGDASGYETLSGFGFLQAFSDVATSTLPQPRYNDIWGAHRLVDCWDIPNGPALNCALALPLLAAELATMSWMMATCVPLCAGTVAAPPAAAACLGCIALTAVASGMALAQWQAAYPEECRMACASGCWGDDPPAADFTCGTAGRHEAPPPGMACAAGLDRCCGVYCEYGTMCKAQSESIGEDADVGGDCGVTRLDTSGAGFPSCARVACKRGYCSDPEGDGSGTCTEDLQQPEGETFIDDPSQPDVRPLPGKKLGSRVTVNCGDPKDFYAQCRDTSLKNFKTGYRTWFLGSYWTCERVWRNNLTNNNARTICDALVANCASSTVGTCAFNNMCGAENRPCCPSTGNGQCAAGLSCTGSICE